ncbi:hypothetical protein GCM10022276_12110 [Sphingomonas limnosediminicola]|uniref:Uncharacterized protein n=1 Tax=Sphingomonas limnosediminicola TaxID=940133 RepID=A0ABP7L7Q7_9SPHN
MASKKRPRLGSETSILATKFEILSGPIVVGYALLERIDRAGATLICEFCPSAEYDVRRHAGLSPSGGEVALCRPSLTARGPSGETVDALDVRIYDYEATAESRIRETYIIGIELEALEAYIAQC